MPRPSHVQQGLALAAPAIVVSRRVFGKGDGDGIFRRQATCADNFEQCSGDAFPDDFCCPSGQTCIGLAANTTLLCCPDGADCSRIRPISCNTAQQNARNNPEAVIKTTALTLDLAHCGDGTCCPFGYSCSGDASCVRDANQDRPPAGLPLRSGSSSWTLAATATATATAAGTATATASRSSNPLASIQPAATDSAPAPGPRRGNESGNGPPTAVVVGGSVGAAVVVVAAAFLAFLFYRRAKQDKDGLDRKRSSTSSFGNFISKPILQTDVSRSEFSRGRPPPPPPPPRRASASASTRTSASARSSVSLSVRSDGPSVTGAVLDDAGRSDEATMYGEARTVARDASASLVGGRRAAPDQDYYARHRREPSSMSIDIIPDFDHDGPAVDLDRFARPHSDMTTMTTFTTMMERAQLGPQARGRGFLDDDTEPEPEPEPEPPLPSTRYQRG